MGVIASSVCQLALIYGAMRYPMQLSDIILCRLKQVMGSSGTVAIIGNLSIKTKNKDLEEDGNTLS